jgi:ribonuclease P/MRP protein subunit RPP1
MPDFYDLCLRETSEDMEKLAEELGWSKTNCSLETVFLKSDNWGDMKEKIGNRRTDADMLVLKGGDDELHRKAAEDGRIDIILHPEKGRKDSGIDHVIAEKAGKNKVAVGFDFQQLSGNSKSKTHILKHWRKNLKLCKKYNAPYIITTGSQKQYELRSPRDLEKIIDSLGYDGRKAVSLYPKHIVDRSQKAQNSRFPGMEVDE